MTRRDIASLDHLVGAQHETSRNVEADGLGSPQIDDQLEPRRLLDRQIGRLGAAQQRGELPAHYVAIELKDAGPIANEATLLRPFRPLIHGRQLQCRSAVQNDLSVVEEERGRQHVEPRGVRSFRRVDRRRDFFQLRNPMDRKLDPACASGSSSALSSEGLLTLVSESVAMRRAPGSASRRISCRLPSSSEARSVTPVVLPPGLANERTNPWPTMSSVKARIGIWGAARTAASPPTLMTSTPHL